MIADYDFGTTLSSLTLITANKLKATKQPLRRTSPQALNDTHTHTLKKNVAFLFFHLPFNYL